MHKLIGCALVTALTVCVPLRAVARTACTIIGQPATLSVAGTVSGNATATVQPGVVEFNPAPGNALVSVDIEGGTIRLFNNTPATVVNFGGSAIYTVTLGGPAPLSVTGISVASSGVNGLAPGSSRNRRRRLHFSLWGVTIAGGIATLICTAGWGG